MLIICMELCHYQMKLRVIYEIINTYRINFDCSSVLHCITTILDMYIYAAYCTL